MMMIVARPDAESAVHGPDARADRATNDGTNWPCRAITLMCSFPGSIDEALRLRADRQTSDSENSSGENEV
jgi:hypothetical protein